MLETNLRIVYPGTNLYVWVKRARLLGTDLTPEIIQRACGSLRHRYGIAAIPEPGETGSLLVATKNDVQGIRLTEADWSVEIQNMGEPPVQIELGSSFGQRVIPLILERALEAQIARTTNLWSMDSPSIWYEPEPIATQDGIALYRRYEIASLFIEGVGVGIAVDVGIAFFSVHNLSYYLDESVSPEEQSARQAQLMRLTDRQERHKGTLLYDNHNVKMKCYLEQFSPGITCDTTGEIRVKDTSYQSLTAYYRATLPGLVFDPDGRAVRVSFAHRGSSVWIAAQLAKIRVGNKQLPRELRNADKISPQERRELTIQFWQNLGAKPFGAVAPAPINGFWRPDEARIIQLPLPDLIFGQDYTLKAPSQLDPRSYRAYYQERDKLLDNKGCYSSHPQMPRTLYFAYPVGLAQEAVRKLAADLTGLVAKWTGRPIIYAEPIPYDSVTQANKKLLESNAEAVIFILGKDPRAYHDAAYKNPWRIKRITERSIKKHFEATIHPVANSSRQNGHRSSAQKQWGGFVRMNALAVLRLLEGVPFRIRESSPFEAQLGIDVGYDRRHFVISLQIARRDDLRPSFRTWTDFQIKPDQQHEAINPIMLNDQIVNTFQRAMGRRFDPIQSLIVFRDGQLFAGEIEGISTALETLKQQGIFSPDVRVELADFRKNSKKSIRIWEYRSPVEVENPLEGVVVLLNGKSAVVTTTGVATLTQGTSQPYLIYAKSEQADLQNIALAAFHGAQLNWSSLRVAQRLPLVLKTADDELKARDAQEIRLLK